ncbi:MAG: MFS transporter [Pseudorhodoplanes sp.]
MSPPPQDMPDFARIGWVRPLIATLAIQAAASFLNRLTAAIAPALSIHFDIRETFIGYFGAVTTAGSMLFLLIGAPLIRRYGPILVLQIGLLFGAGSLLLMLLPHWMFIVFASFAIGLGYGPSAQAANEVLQQTAPPRHRNLIFSIKQAGVPIGGVMAGLALPPLVDAFGWQSTIFFSIVVVTLTVIGVEPLRARIDSMRDPNHPAGLRAILSIESLVSPVVALRENKAAMRLALTGALFASTHGVWIAFIVTYAVSGLQMSLARGGLLLALSQGTGIFGRLVLGYLADRMGSGVPALALIAVTSATATILLGLTDASWPFWLILLFVIAAGLMVSSWNGLVLSEIGRHSPRGRAAESFAGANLLLFVGYLTAPPLFAVMVDHFGYRTSFILLGLLTLTALWPLAQLWRSR